MKLIRNLARFAVVPAALIVAGLALAAPASAHVTVTPSETAAGSYTVLTVSVPHGCDGSPTTKVAIKLPENITTATPTRNPFYDIETVTAKLDKPITSEDGGQITERISQIVYTAKTPLPDGQRDTFELSLQIPEDAAGQTLVFPAVQTCSKDETAWTEVPSPGQSAHDLAHPAPSFTVAPASGGQSAGDAGAGGTEAAGTPGADHDAADSNNSGSSNTGLAIAGLVAGLAGLLLGAAALVRSRGRA